MFILRKLGRLLFGAASAFQLMAACLLGALAGFVPGFEQAPGLLLTLLVLVLILNVNLFLVSVTALVAKGLSLLLLPLSFAIGRLLLDGPLQGLFATFINAPVLALFGFEYYVVTGGILPALLLGTLFGVLVYRGLSKLHAKLVALDRDSASFHLWAAKPWVRILSWLLLGGKPDPKQYEKYVSRHFGNPVRVVGIVVVLLLMGVTVLAWQQLRGPLLGKYVKAGLERANGSTVDLRNVQLDIREGSILIEGLAMSNPQALDTNLFATERLVADVSGMDLLRKRLRLSLVSVSDAASGTAREHPGVLLYPPKEPLEPPMTEGRTIDDYVKEAEMWRDRLQQLQRWIDKLSGPEEGEKQKPLSKRLEELIRLDGMANVRAEHLLEGAPTLQIDRLEVNGMVIRQLGDRQLDLAADFLSTQPHLVSAAPSIRLAARDESLLVNMILKEAAKGGAGEQNLLDFVYLDLPMETANAMLTERVGSRFTSGTVDIRLSGGWNAAQGLHLPVELDLKNVQTNMGGREILLKSTKVPFTLAGSFAQPRVLWDGEGTGKSLVEAGKSQALDEASGEISRRLGDKGVDPDAAGKTLDNLKRGLFGGEKPAE